MVEGLRADNFSTVEIDPGPRPAPSFDANAYSFFGDSINADVGGGLEGDLEWALEVKKVKRPPRDVT